MGTQYSTTNAVWKRDLVLIAKNTHVWLSQLSAKYKTEITQIDQIPDDELDKISSRGFNALWLVGLWQRSPASKIIKQLYGRENTIASAYSIYDYRIADDLGGEAALKTLKKKADKYDIRLACDMVPNHTGLDSPWIFQHPERYISIKESPREGFSYKSPNLSNNPNAEIFLDEGYYTQTGAAEVFKFVPGSGSEALYIYHGNDGTSMPWNDTAQLNYLNTDTRRAVRDEIVSVARKFKVIRLDAAMTLVRKHFKRLWFPSGAGKNFIPTRGNINMTVEEFNRLMPEEFWVEVIRDLSIQAPDTLLIAEAFWLMEKFFINEIGMHRVYNSAFMHQLRDEQNKEFRNYLIDILQSNPLMLDHFVNFLTTPDEDTTFNQFGKSDKYLGACRLLACLPGLPMFGHGQWEGLRERYGMDISRPMMAEEPDQELILVHDQSISPLLKRRSWFSSAENFRLFDFNQSENLINENIIAFGNCIEGHVSLVVFNNSPAPSQGFIKKCANQVGTSGKSKSKQCPSFYDWLVLLGFESSHIRLSGLTTVNEITLPVSSIEEKGIPFKLRPYESFVFEIGPA